MIAKIKFKSQIFVLILALLHFFMLMLNETESTLYARFERRLLTPFHALQDSPCYTFSS